MIEKINLQNLKDLSEGENDYSNLMIDLLDFKSNWFNRKFVFKKAFEKINVLVREIEKIDLSKLSIKEGCKIKHPSNIDNITFIAMMDLHSYVDGQSDQNQFDYMTEIICIACFSENVNGDYINGSRSFNSFRKRILSSPAFEMVGLYNWINDKLGESQIEWNRRFLSVQVDDPDYDQAGGAAIMSQFNVINTVKGICKDFNVTYEQAWQISYAVSQTNNYARASEAKIQEKMTKIKEGRIKAERGVR